MKEWDVIFEKDIYKIKLVEMIHKNETHTGFNFHLFKGDEFFKYYSLATGKPYNYELMKSTVIGIFKPLMK